MKRGLPNNIIDNDLDLFVNGLEQKKQEHHYHTLKNVYINYWGVCFSIFAIKPQTYLTARTKKNCFKSLLFRIKNWLFRKKIRIDNAIWATDSWSENYFHWHLDVCQRLLFLAEKTTILQNQYNLLIPIRLGNFDFVAQSVRYLFPKLNIQYIQEHEVYYCKNIVIPELGYPSGDFDPLLVHILKAKINKSYPFNKLLAEGEHYVYISRHNARHRKVLNEAEIVPLLLKYKFQIVYTENLNYQNQINLFQHCKLLLSSHGAGLTNMLFMKPQSNIVELRHGLDNHYNCYLRLASDLNINYYYLKCDYTLEDAHSADLIVDTNALDSLLSNYFDNLD